MKEISLTQGKFSIVDDEDYEWAMQWKWKLDSKGYAARMESKKLGSTTILLHREISKTPPGMSTDHVNGNKLDNRKSNLRNCTHAENLKNRAMPKNNTSGFKGVCRHGSRWRAKLYVGGKAVHLGIFNNPVDAARAYDEAAKFYYGDFARLNL